MPQKEFQFSLRLVFAHWIFNGKEKLFSPFLITKSWGWCYEKFEKAFVLSKCPVPVKILRWILIQNQKWILDTMTFIFLEWEGIYLRNGILNRTWGGESLKQRASETWMVSLRTRYLVTFTLYLRDTLTLEELRSVTKF